MSTFLISAGNAATGNLIPSSFVLPALVSLPSLTCLRITFVPPAIWFYPA
jgi:hypothetical protein